VRYGTLFAIKACVVALAVADIAASGWLSSRLTTQRPLSPQGMFNVPFQTHGGTTYISQTESYAHIALILGGLLVVLAWWFVSRFEKTPKTS
jgi:hypothetical protein